MNNLSLQRFSIALLTVSESLKLTLHLHYRQCNSSANSLVLAHEMLVTANVALRSQWAHSTEFWLHGSTQILFSLVNCKAIYQVLVEEHNGTWRSAIYSSNAIYHNVKLHCYRYVSEAVVLYLIIPFSATSYFHYRQILDSLWHFIPLITFVKTYIAVSDK